MVQAVRPLKGRVAASKDWANAAKATALETLNMMSELQHMLKA